MTTTSKVREVGVINGTAAASQRKAALVVGVGLLIMTVAAVFAITVHGSVIVPGDAAATANNILANELQFRLAVIGFLFVVALDVIVAWGLYVFLRPVNSTLSLLAACFRVVYAAVFLVTILELGHALTLLHSADAPALLAADQLQAQALLTLSAFSDGWALALALFGLHLVLIGHLVFNAGYMPKLLGALLVIAGFGYVFDSVTGFLFPNFGVTIGQFTFIGELLLALWLLIKSASVKQWNKLALEAA